MRNKQYASVFLFIRLLALCQDCTSISRFYTLKEENNNVYTRNAGQLTLDLEDLFNSLISREKTRQSLASSLFPSSVLPRIPLDKKS